jgi:hypothetical protein
VVFYIVPYILCGDCIQIYLVLLWYFVFRYLVLNKWYQSTFLGRKCGQIFLFFADLFFRKKKKRVATFQTIYIGFGENFQKMVVYLSSSQKNTQVKKKNRLKRSPGSQVICILKSAIFRVFFFGRRPRDFSDFCSI